MKELRPQHSMHIKDKLNWFNTMALNRTADDQTLKLYIESKSYTLLTSEEDPCLAGDSDIQVYMATAPKLSAEKQKSEYIKRTTVKAGSTFFKKQKDSKKKKSIPWILIRTKKREIAKTFPMKKLKDSNGVIINVKLE